MNNLSCIANQQHLTQWINWGVSTKKLWDLFQQYKIQWYSPQQIIRLTRDNYGKFLNSSEHITFFNTPDDINNQLIQQLNSQSRRTKDQINTVLIWEISHNQEWNPIIKEISLKPWVVDQMRNMSISEIYERELYKNWLWWFQTIDELIYWLEKDFYAKKEWELWLERNSKLLVRSVKLINN